MERDIRKILTFVKRSVNCSFGKIIRSPCYFEDSSSPRMTEQIQLLQRRLECISRDPKVLWIAQKVFLIYLRGNRCWVPLYEHSLKKEKTGRQNNNNNRTATAQKIRPVSNFIALIPSSLIRLGKLFWISILKDCIEVQ